MELSDRKLAISVPQGWENGSQAIRARYSSIALDHFHSSLLNSNQDNDILHGLVSVVFWGNASGTDGRINAPFALERAHCLLRGKRGRAPTNSGETISILREARNLAQTGKIAEGLRIAMNIKFLGMAFASKVLMFTNPSNAAVYDKVISIRLKEYKDPQLQELAVNTLGAWAAKKAEQANKYERWCAWCTAKANVLNRAELKWLDWDGSETPWRAVDVERAFYALGRAKR